MLNLWQDLRYAVRVLAKHSQERSNGTPRTDVFSYPLYRELRDRNSVFTGLCAAASDHEIEVEAGKREVSDLKIAGRMVSGN